MSLSKSSVEVQVENQLILCLRSKDRKSRKQRVGTIKDSDLKYNEIKNGMINIDKLSSIENAIAIYVQR